MVNPGDIRNKIKRREVFQRRLDEKRKEKADKKKKRKREELELGPDAPPKQVPKTLDNTREYDETVVHEGDEEVELEEEHDEFAEYFKNMKTPKIMITTRPRPSAKLFPFISDLMMMLPNAFFYPRRKFDLPDICKWARNKEFTHLIVLHENRKSCHRMLLIHLGAGDAEIGPTALFKISSITNHLEIKGHANTSFHLPEIILNRFQTRIGHRIGRFLGSLFSHSPEFKGRNVVTFHNQRDFIFVRHHRYKFTNDGKAARLQEIGPRFTMKLLWLMKDVFDTKHGEYEWILKRKEMETSRRKFFL